jgi:hypothetical protein
VEKVIHGVHTTKHRLRVGRSIHDKGKGGVSITGDLCLWLVTQDTDLTKVVADVVVDHLVTLLDITAAVKVAGAILKVGLWMFEKTKILYVKNEFTRLAHLVQL